MKKLIALMLALCLCFTLAACGEKEEEISKGEKMYQKYKEIINYMDDGNFEAAYDAMVNLAGDKFDQQDNSNLVFQAMEDIFNCLAREDFSGAIQAIIRLENSKNQKEPTDFMKLLCTDWYSDKYTSWDYTCDSEGRVISAVVTGTDYTSYASYTQEYIYKDLYFYEP